MPYKVRKVGDKYKVQTAETGRTVGTHDTKAAAERQLRALYANVPEARRRRR